MFKPRDSTRLKKTYSYSRQRPLTVSTTTSNLDRVLDTTRWRQTYMSIRNEPQVIETVATTSITTEALDNITTEDGSNIVVE